VTRPTSAGQPPASLLTDRTAYLLHRAGYLILHHVEQELQPLELTGRMFFVLAMVRSHAPLSQQDVSHLFSLDPTTVVTIVDEFERMGLVTRRRNVADRRRYDLVLTPAGEERLSAAMKVLAGVEKQFFRSLTPQRRAALHRALDDVLDDDGA
jgi:DNA-binding MarR family transcriptional regulator